MGRKARPEQLEAIFREVERHPGRRPGWIARLLGVPRSQVTRSLPALEERGFLLSEDQHGRLWPFRRQS
jgi:DNA-binding IclR family transcriptional regulator